MQVINRHNDIFIFLAESEQKLYNDVHINPSRSRKLYNRGLEFITLSYLKIMKQQLQKYA